jgi:hypothetical protein
VTSGYGHLANVSAEQLWDPELRRTSGAGPLHSDVDEALARSLDASAADWKIQATGGGVVHSVGIVRQVGDGLVDGLVLADADVLLSGRDQFIEDGRPGAAAGDSVRMDEARYILRCSLGHS